MIQRRVQQNFQRGFHTYNDTAYMQKHIAAKLARLFAQTAKTPHFKNALEIGCGTGFLTQELVPNLSVDHWTMNDLVTDSQAHIAPMLGTHQWDFLAGAIETQHLPHSYDLITSASVFQWVNNTKTLLAKLSDNLTSGGWMIISSFGTQHFQELQSLTSKPQTMQYLDPSDWRTVLPDNLTPHHISQDIQTAKFSTVRKLLMHLRNTGVNANAQHHWSRQKLADFEQAYARRFSDPDGNICLTYAPVYVIAQKQ